MARPDQPQRALGAAVRELREKRGISQEDLAHQADITTSTVSLIERGRSNPTWSTVKSLARALDVSLAQFAALVDKHERS